MNLLFRVCGHWLSRMESLMSLAVRRGEGVVLYGDVRHAGFTARDDFFTGLISGYLLVDKKSEGWASISTRLCEGGLQVGWAYQHAGYGSRRTCRCHRSTGSDSPSTDGRSLTISTVQASFYCNL